MDPINYSGMMTQIDLSPLQRGFALRNERQQAKAAQQERTERVQLAQAQFTQKQEEDAAWRADLTDLATDFSPEKLRNTMWKHPGHQETLSNGFSTYTKAVQRDVIGSTSSVLSALGSGNAELAAKVLTDRRAALEKGNINSDQTDALLQLVRSTDPADRQKAYAMLGTIMSGAVGPEHAAGIMETFGIGAKAEDRRADNLRAERTLELNERRTANAERATNAAIAGRDRDDARADRRASDARGGRGGRRGPSGLPSGFKLD